MLLKKTIVLMIIVISAVTCGKNKSSVLEEPSASCPASKIESDLPDWYEKNRIQALVGAIPITNVELSTLDPAVSPISTQTAARREITKGFLNATKEMKDLGLNAYTRILKNSWEGPTWPSDIPQDAFINNLNENLTPITIDAKNRGVHLGAYYWDGGEGRVRETPTTVTPDEDLFPGYFGSNYTWAMPDAWLCKDLSGIPIKATPPDALGQTRGFLSDFASGYKSFVKTRLHEMSERGIEMFYFDERHMPNIEVVHKEGACFGSEIQNLYLAQGGVLPAAKNWNDLNFRKYVQFQGGILTHTFKEWKDSFQGSFKKPVFTISGTFLSKFTLPYMNLDLAAVADSIKVEYLNGVRGFLADDVFIGMNPIATPPRDIALSLGWVIPRDASDGRAPNVWFNGMKNAETVKAFVATVMGYGNIANLNVHDKIIRGLRNETPVSATNYSDLQEGVSLGKKISPIMSYTRPYKFAAIHLSEANRNAINYSGGEDWTKLVWKKLMWPVTAAYSGFVRAGIPVGIITDRQILRGDLSGFKVLYLPEDVNSIPEVNTKIENFKAAGGKVVLHNKALNESLASPATNAATMDDINTKLLSEVESRIELQVLSKGSNSKIHSAFFVKGSQKKIIVSIINDFTFISNYHRIQGGYDPEGVKPPLVNGGDIVIRSKVKPILPKESLSGKKLSVIFEDNYYLISGLDSFQELSLVEFELKDSCSL